MSNPDVTENIQDFGLGVVESGAGSAEVSFGLCVGGTNNTVYGLGSVSAAKAQLIAGELLESVVSKLSAGVPVVYAVRCNPTTYGSNGTVTHTGPGTGTVTPSTAPHAQILVKITTGGAAGTYQIAVSYDGGVTYGSPVVSSAGAWVYDVPNTYLRITFANASHTLNNVFTFATDGTISQTGADTLPTKAASAIDRYDMIVAAVVGGALGTATFKYSLDGGDNYSAEIQIPGGGKYVVPNTGIVLTFASTFTAGDTYAWTASAPSYGTSDLSAAMDAANTDTSAWAMAHIVGVPASAAAAASVAATVDTKMTAAQSAYRFARAVVECPSDEGDAAVKSAFANFGSLRVGVACGAFEHLSPLTGRINKRNAAWAFMARAGTIGEGEAPHWVGRGPLDQVKSLYRDEGVTPGLDSARFITLRTFAGFAGYYVTRGRLMAPGGSDFTFWANGRVMDRACTIARQISLPIVGQKLRVDRTTGKILEVEAKRIEKRIQRAIEADLVARGQASAVTVAVDRANNVLSTQTVNIDIGIVPVGYSDFVNETLHFVNPALA
jgi:VCBS repeat-containing protein